MVVFETLSQPTFDIFIACYKFCHRVAEILLPICVNASTYNQQVICLLTDRRQESDDILAVLADAMQ